MPLLRARLRQESDLVERVVQFIVAISPDLAERASEIEDAIRGEFHGQAFYVSRLPRDARQRQRERLARQALALFNGRSATEVARELDISRATVYRLLKQPGER